MRYNTRVWKIEINSHGESSIGWHTPAVVKVTLDFDSNDPTKRSSHQRCSVKRGVLKDFANFTETPALESNVNNEETQFSGLQLYLKRDPGTGVFLRILRNF